MIMYTTTTTPTKYTNHNNDDDSNTNANINRSDMMKKPQLPTRPKNGNQ